ncbi:gliding motility-associated C-terminal domain-containing protein [Flavobacterium antarcticum]|uniref:gliding motility-associated C-terminal domain-containing protein n=1 Tax=Flavobacterium antarcticum TaxID=271155 RepID=UPI001FE0457D|nr:gliding motility-associated C-terminal domain-containing protein [Flavobacterium antarcticum]
MLYISEDTKFSTIGALDNQGTGKFYNDGEAFIYSDFNNDGILDFYNETGITRFIGSANQILSGTNTSFLHNAYFNNASTIVPFKVSGLVDFNGVADFYDGILDNRNFGGKISFSGNANHINTSDLSHVNGSVIKFGNTDFIYPIGDKNLYRFAGISAPADILSTFTGQYYFDNSDVLYSHSKKQPEIELINNMEYWTLTKEDGKNDILLTLSWDEITTTPLNIIASPETDIHIVRWDENSDRWVDEGGVADVSSKTVTTAVEVKGYGVFTLARMKALDTSCIKIFNVLTPKKQDGINDYFFIECINNYPNNTVEIFNRWGVKVFGTKNYDSNGNVFKGFSDGRTTIDGSEMLPSGTYFYILSYEKDDVAKPYTKKQSGYLYLQAE